MALNPYAPANAATALRTLRELGSRNWNAWFLIDGTQEGNDLSVKSAYNSYFLNYDVSGMEYNYTRRMQMLLFSAATNTWRTDLEDPDVVADLGEPTFDGGPWQAIYDVSTLLSEREELPHPDETTRFVDAIKEKSPNASTGRVLLAAIIDGSDSFKETSGFAAWETDSLLVPGTITAIKNASDALRALGRNVDTLIIKCSGYDSQDATNVYDFDGTTISVGGDTNRYGDDEDDYEAPTPTLNPAIPAVTISATVNAALDVAALRTAWFATPTEPDNGSNDMAETMLEGIRHAIGYSSLHNSPTAYESKHVIIATDAMMKMPVDQYYDGFDWPDIPIVTKTWDPLDIPINIEGTLSIDMTKYVSGSFDADVELSALLIPVFQEPIGGAL